MALRCQQLGELVFFFFGLFFSIFLAANTGLQSAFRQTIVDTVPEFRVARQVACLFLSLRLNSWQTVLRV